jgi:hypothetical protein
MPMRPTLIATFVLLLNTATLLACPMCKDSVPASDAPSAGGLPGGFNSSIYLMLGSLFCVIGMITWTLVKGSRSAGGSSPSPRRAFPIIPPTKQD